MCRLNLRDRLEDSQKACDIYKYFKIAAWVVYRQYEFLAEQLKENLLDPSEYDWELWEQNIFDVIFHDYITMEYERYSLGFSAKGSIEEPSS